MVVTSLLVVALSFLQPLLSAAGSYHDHGHDHEDRDDCITAQVAVADKYTSCIYQDKYNPKCQKDFMYEWKALATSHYGEMPICPKITLAAQSVFDQVSVCLGAHFPELTCHKLSDLLIELSHEQDEPSEVCCPAEEFPYCLVGTAACCADGKWSCPSNGWYWCENEWTWQGPFGEKCESGGCPTDKKHCPDDTEVGRDPENDCEFFECPTIVCTTEKKQCADGSYVTRDPDDDCNFEPCCCDPQEHPYCYTGKAECCADGHWSCPTDGWHWCEGEWTWKGPFGEMCEESLHCPYDLKVCSDGSKVGRDPENKCEFYPCPESDACCDPHKEPGKFGNPICFEGHRCCPNGEWSCSVGDGQTFPCGDDLTTGPFGRKCEEVDCPCSSYIYKVDEHNIDREISCDPSTYPSMLTIQQKEVKYFPMGTYAELNAYEGECSMGDAINIISKEEAKVCVEEIADRCHALGCYVRDGYSCPEILY